MPRARFRGGLVALAGLVAVLAGCAAVPQSGSVHVGRVLPAGGGQAQVDIAHVIAAAPVSGMTPASLVTGFLNSLVDSDSDYHVARLYLAPGAKWQPTTRTTLYDQRSVVHLVGAHTVGVVLQRLGTIDRRGNYHVAPATLHARFTVVRSDRQWRIAHLPNGILLSTSDAARTLQPATIYFFNHAQTRLVPDPLLVPPDEPGLATTLIDELVDGPSEALAPAVTTAVPKGTDLVGNVPIDSSGVAAVDLEGGVQQESATQLKQLSAQIVWTLRQLPTVTAVRLLVNGAPLTVAGVPKVQPIGSWPQFDPEAPPTSAGALVAGSSRVVSVGGTVPPALASGRLQDPTISADGTRVAALREHSGRTTLLVGSPGGPLSPRWTAASVSSPSFDPQGDLLFVSGVGSGARVLDVPPTGRVRRVSLPSSVRAQGVSAVAVSRDGSRIAMIVGPPGGTALVVSAITAVRGVPAVIGNALVVSGHQDVQGLAWGGANEIVTTIRESSSRRTVLETTVDGYQVHTAPRAGLPDDATQVAGAPGQPILAAAGGAIWRLSGSVWARVRGGSDPSYAG